MTNSSFDGEVFGARTLYAVIVAASVAILLGSIWSPATVVPAAGISAPAPQIVVTAAAPGHVS